MEENSYPRILIFGQSFTNSTGGGITISNLFKGWPKEKISVAVTGHASYNVSTEICDTYYQLGIEEYRWIFPFNLIQKPFPSGLKSFDQNSTVSVINKKTGIREVLINKIFFPLLRWLGLSHCISKIFLSQSLKDWLVEYNPELLYFHVSSLEGILFAKELRDYLKIPAAIHMMDDWPSTIGKKGLLKKFWRTKIDRELRQLLNKVDLYLSISNAMTSEYLSRYNKNFIAFHNPIETKSWQPYSKTDFKLNNNDIKILYSGRIGPGITESLIEVAHAIDSINNIGMKIKLLIQSPSWDYNIIKRLQEYKCVIINPIVDYSELPKVFSQADLLLIANDFSNQGIDFLRYSMPTKISEYMISGTPVLVYAPGETAVSRFVSDNECGYCITDQSTEKLSYAIQFLISDEEFRKRLSQNSVRIAKELFDAEKVRKEFHQLLINLSKKENYVQK
jgi:glycosyltransferase involved in cell wall biosynthesis